MKLSRAAFILTISILWPAMGAGAQEKAPVPVTLVQLAASPEIYDGKLVEVSGYLVLAERGGRLFAHREDVESNLLANSVRVERTEEMDSAKEELDGKYVAVVGVFRQGEVQRKGAGLLHEIRSCRLLRQPPGKPGSPQELAASEAAAARDLRALNTACVTYAVGYSIGYPAVLSYLGPSNRLDKTGAGLIDQKLASGKQHGYVFTYTAGKIAAGRITSYTIHADPEVQGSTGQRHFFTDESGVLRVNASRRASASDPAYEEAAKTAAAPAGTPGRIRVSKEVQAANLIVKVAPIYPPLARAARIQGIVRMRAVIAKDGTVQQLDVVSGPPVLVQAAIEAAKQWRYAPTEWNGQRVEVETVIDVIFSLGDKPQ